MKFEIPFDIKTYLNQTELIVPYIYSHLIKKVKISLIMGVLLLIIGSVLLLKNEDSGVILIIISLIVLYDSYRKNNHYNRTKVAFMDIMKKNVTEKADGLKTGTFEFLPDKLIYTDDLSSSTISWPDFEGYKVVKSNLLMIVNQKDGNIQVIGEKEVGIEKFNLAVDFVKQHVK